MIERLLIASVLLVLGAAVYCFYCRRAVSRVNNFQSSLDPVLANLRPGIPTIVYFTTPQCIPCRIQQQPALEALRIELGDDGIQIVRIDATEKPEIAEKWGVMTAPTTFILDSQGATHSVNYGFADVNKLKRQLKAS